MVLGLAALATTAFVAPTAPSSFVRARMTLPDIPPSVYADSGTVADYLAFTASACAATALLSGAPHLFAGAKAMANASDSCELVDLPGADPTESWWVCDSHSEEARVCQEVEVNGKMVVACAY